ncbi:hypothetical protein FHS25_003756 [Rhizobium laguerreae]|uniref:Uncharacterized protein n=1 Tax=Rhizobium laguerreae TaxID=1076926 RepID=A0ABR6GCH2_9HYPH|nr:hypothetical protein [Rhizobium laguerreae]
MPTHHYELLKRHTGGKADATNVRSDNACSLLTRFLSNHSHDMNCHLLVFPGIFSGRSEWPQIL